MKREDDRGEYISGNTGSSSLEFRNQDAAVYCHVCVLKSVLMYFSC